MKIEISELQYNGIPYNEYSRTNIESRGLVFIQHGYESNKNRGADYIAINLARLGFRVVSIDAHKHGVRIEEPYISEAEYIRFKEAFKVIDKTGDDILELYNDLYKEEYPLFDFVGISMGGMIAYNTAMKTRSIRKLIPVISTPLLFEFAEWLVDREKNEDYTIILDEVKHFIKEIDPSRNSIHYNELYIINTTKDNTVPPIYSEKYILKNMNSNVQFKLFEDKHNVNKSMQEDILGFIAEEKVVL